MKTDKQIRQDVERELEWDPAVNAAGIGVEVCGRIVTLAGHLGSYSEKLAAEKAAQRVEGVRALSTWPRVRRDDGRYDCRSESSRRILCEFGEFTPRNEPSCELFAIE